MRLTAVIAHSADIRQMLGHSGVDSQPRPRART